MSESRLFVTMDAEEGAKLNEHVKIRVVGVGGGGCNAVSYMMEKNIEGVELISINTDLQSLELIKSHKKVQIGKNISKGQGAGANPQIGKQAAIEDTDAIKEVLKGSDMIFVTCGMGGGTGTGAAPVVAEIAKELKALVVGIVTKPFLFEGPKKIRYAEQGIEELKKHVDSLIVIHNSKLINLYGKELEAFKGFDKPNDILFEATKAISDIITIKGKINVDFADVKTIMTNSGLALMGTGKANGENRAIEAAQMAIQSPLLEGVDIRGAQKILINVTASAKFSLSEIEEGAKVVYDSAAEDVEIIFGAVEKEEMGDYVAFTVIATSFAGSTQNAKSTKKPEPDPEKRATLNIWANVTEKNPDKHNLEVPAYIRNAQNPDAQNSSNVNVGISPDDLNTNIAQEQKKKLDPKANKYSTGDDKATPFMAMILD